jgi:hypothetical protein
LDRELEFHLPLQGIIDFVAPPPPSYLQDVGSRKGETGQNCILKNLQNSVLKIDVVDESLCLSVVSKPKGCIITVLALARHRSFNCTALLSVA